MIAVIDTIFAVAKRKPEKIKSNLALRDSSLKRKSRTSLNFFQIFFPQMQKLRL